jgi:hypothetical protein
VQLDSSVWFGSRFRSDPKEIRFSKPVSLENIRKSKLDSDLYDYTSWGTLIEDFTEIFQSHVCNLRPRRGGISRGGYVNASITPPVIVERNGLLIVPRRVLEGDIPNEVCSRRLARIEWNECNDRLLPWPRKYDPGGLDAYISPNLGLSNAASFFNGRLHIAGLSYTASPGDNPKANRRDSQYGSEPSYSLVVIGSAFIDFRFRGYFWGILAGLGLCAIISWIDCLDRKSYRKNRNG